ncbi:hypothetical protein LEP1GSC193_2645 [Leptospira alstonii serovar Pingchang str. 80-412]|uniref:Uncharacterized protein n=2 Tax=Leptospira alstonii TaxID=28452 RepID=M6CUF4_9LEPT|nr:hypothetical protein LEP1GSC194_0216 [Leptospira alstonii serovar Sichuan str. 79601]EQA79217.1 hypothetical protein LEP1GSC193_2645 [Leptospira alstonii serovar Pingchang str. 80-412]
MLSQYKFLPLFSPFETQKRNKEKLKGRLRFFVNKSTLSEISSGILLRGIFIFLKK